MLVVLWLVPGVNILGWIGSDSFHSDIAGIRTGADIAFMSTNTITLGSAEGIDEGNTESTHPSES